MSFFKIGVALNRMSASEYVLFIDASPIGRTLESADVKRRNVRKYHGLACVQRV